MDEQEAVLALAERSGVENLKERLASGDRLAASADKLLGLLLAGIGGALALGRTAFEPGTTPASVWGAAAVAAYWCVVAVLLVRGCIMTRWTEVVYNEPKNLYQPASGWTLLQVRQGDINFLQDRIEATKRRNRNVAWWLDRCSIAATLAPAVFGLVTWAVAAGR